MKCCVKVSGVEIEFENLEIGHAVHFQGVGWIVASAISHESKNRYTACVITQEHLTIRSGITLRQAVIYLQVMYDKYGGFDNPFRQGKTR